jgi:hypothetical protein
MSSLTCCCSSPCTTHASGPSCVSACSTQQTLSTPTISSRQGSLCCARLDQHSTFHTPKCCSRCGTCYRLFGHISWKHRVSNPNCQVPALQVQALAAVITQALHAGSSSSSRHSSGQPDGISRPPIIALLLPRSLEYVVCSLAALAAG